MKRINIRESLLNMDRETDCRYDLTSLYESVKLDDEKKKQLCQYIDKVDIDATNRFLSNEASSQGLMENTSDDIADEELNEWVDDEWYGDDESTYEYIASKSVSDADGFYTDYTWYRNVDTDEHVFVFGDTDIYKPEDGDFDHQCDSQEEAQEWFDSYNGLDEVDESLINESKEVEIPENADTIKFKDVGGGFGGNGTEVLSLKDVMEYWNKEHNSDPTLMEYDSFEEWWAPTKDNYMKPFSVTNKDVEIPKGANHIHYRDSEPVMGADASVYSLAELMHYWNENHSADPILVQYDSYDDWWAETSKSLELIESLNEATVNYVDKYNNYTIYECDGKFIADVSDSKLGSKRLTASSIDELKDQIDEADKEYSDYYHKLPESLTESPEFISIEPVQDNRKWQYSIGGKDVPYTEYDEAKAHFKDEFNIADYRDELNDFIRSHKGYEYRFDVDVVRDNGEDKLYIDIPWGDWKHEHWAADHLVQKFFMDKGLIVKCDTRTYEEDGSDTYSAEHFYSLDDFVLSGRVIKESLTESIRSLNMDGELELIQSNVVPGIESYKAKYVSGELEGKTFVFVVSEAKGCEYIESKGFDSEDFPTDALEINGEDKNYFIFMPDELSESLNEAWTDAYEQFNAIVDKHFPDENKIESEVENLYSQHKGEEDWDEAYRRWYEDDNVIEEDIDEDEVTTVTFTFDPSQWSGNPNNLEDYFEYSPDQLTFNPSTVDGPTQVEMTGTLRYINDFKSKYSDLFESLNEEKDLTDDWFNDTSFDVIDSGWTTDGELVVILNNNASDIEEAASDLTRCIQNNNYHVIDWNVNGSNVFIFEVIHNDDYNNLANDTDYFRPTNESLSKQTLDEGWFSDDDFEDDMMHTDLYGGDPMYCRTCGSKIDYSDGYGFCPKCNPQDDELEYVGEESIVDPDDLELVSNRFNPDDPGFDEYDLRESLTDNEILSLLDKAPQVKSNIRSTEFYTENNQRFLDLVFSTSTDSFDYNSYKKELKKIFKDIYINSDNNCITIDITDIDTNTELEEGLRDEVEFYYLVTEDNEEEEPIEYFTTKKEAIAFAKKQDIPTIVRFCIEPSIDDVPHLVSEIELTAPYKENEVVWRSVNESKSIKNESKNVGIAFDAEAPEEYSESEIEDTVTKALDKTPVNVSGYMEVHSLDEDLESDLDKRYRPSSISSRQLEKLIRSELVEDVQVITMYDNEVAKLTSVDGKVFFLVPSTLSQFDVYDEQENLVATNLFTSEIPNELLATGEPNYTYQIVGGKYAGNYSREEIEALPCFSGEYTKEARTVRSELANQPILDGYLSPMFNGWRENHTVCIRYETEEVYNMLSEDGKNLSSKKGTLGSFVASDNDLLKTFTTKEEIINWLLDIEPNCTDKKYLNKIKMQVIHARNFYAAYQLLYNAMLKGDGLGSIEKEIRGTKKFAYESVQSVNGDDLAPQLIHELEASNIDISNKEAVVNELKNNWGYTDEEAEGLFTRIQDAKDFLKESWRPAYKELEKATHDVYDQGGWSEEMSEEETAELDKKAVAAAKSLLNKHSDDPDWQEAYKRLQVNFDEHGIKESLEESTKTIKCPVNGLYNGKEDNCFYFKDGQCTLPRDGGKPSEECKEYRDWERKNSLQEDTDKALTYQELMDLALENYDNGGDRVYECWDERDFEEAVAEIGPITKSKALEIFDHCNTVDNEYRAAARYFSGEIEESLTEDAEENWAVFATDVETGKEYCAGVYESEDYAHYWAAQDKIADSEFQYGNFKYRIEQVPEYTAELDASRKELDSLKISNHQASQEELRTAFDEE